MKRDGLDRKYCPQLPLARLAPKVRYLDSRRFERITTSNPLISRAGTVFHISSSYEGQQPFSIQPTITRNLALRFSTSPKAVS